MNSCDFNYFPYNKFNYFKHVHVFFFSFNEENEFNLLLHRSFGEKSFSDISTKIIDIDGSSINSVCRILTTKFRGLFSQENFKALAQNTPIKLESFEVFADLDPENIENLPGNLFFKTNCYNEWLEKFCDPFIQCDNIEGKIIYFFEIPWLGDNLNEKLVSEDANYPFEFKYFDYCKLVQLDYAQEYKFSDSHDKLGEYIHSTTLDLCKHFNMKEHVSNSQQLIKNEELENYIVLSLEVFQETENVFPNKGIYEFVQLVGNLRRNSERWIFLNNKMPDKNMLKNNCKAIIIPGSHSSVYDYEPHTLDAIHWLQNFKHNKDQDDQLNEVKLLGICFGHQIINEAFGGRVRKNKGGEFLNFVEIVNVDTNFWNFSFVKNSGIDETKFLLKIYEIHGDEVYKTGEGLKSYGTSDSCTNEICVSEDGSIFTTQGHPELSPSIFYSNVMKNTHTSFQQYSENLKQYVNLKQIKGISDSEIFYKIYYSFLKQ